MLFVIQHLQARDRTVMQRKLDEILRSLPNADNRVIAVGEAPTKNSRL
jgi:low affinity Fe/Cu permease